MLQHACCNEKMKDYALLALRIAVGVIFIYQGWLKLNNIEFVTTMFDEVGIPLAGFFAYLVAIVEFLGGIAVLVGFYTSGFALL
ncbi:MAG TPA: DoxX family protein, partial [Patescibacteria group bacterium]|nr:DoxX family protein [Patescibacteria group bacterium]